jgi:hypothetical protein
MMKISKLLLAFTVLLCESLSAQEKSMNYSGEFESIYTSTSAMPFWLVHNQSGRYGNQTGNGFLLNLSGRSGVKDLFFKGMTFEAGGNIVLSTFSDVDCQINELYGKLYYSNLKLEAGLFTDTVQFAGLSSTNGNICRSLNARPYPKVRLATKGYIPFLVGKSWLRIAAEFDEGLLNDNRYVDGVHMHHKSFYMQFRLAELLHLSMGIDHFVMWGGTSPDKQFGIMPDNFGAYLKYISGRPGSSEFPQTDRDNVCGNQYGAYMVQLKQDFNDFTYVVNFSHPFDDHSGMEFANIEDNLYGLHVAFKKGNGITDILYEFITTKKQGLDSLYAYCPESGDLIKLHDDDYYNHGVYLSGATFHNYAMVSPLFAPVIIQDGISKGFENSRFNAHHLGVKGNLSNSLKWKTLLTCAKYYGTWKVPFEPPFNQFSGLLELSFQKEGFPVNIALSIAADAGGIYEDNVGGIVKISKSW